MFSDFSVDFAIFENYNKNLIEYFDEYQKDSISGIMILQKFSKNDYIIREREQAEAVFILKEVKIFHLFIIFLLHSNYKFFVNFY